MCRKSLAINEMTIITANNEMMWVAFPAVHHSPPRSRRSVTALRGGSHESSITVPGHDLPRGEKGSQAKRLENGVPPLRFLRTVCILFFHFLFSCYLPVRGTPVPRCAAPGHSKHTSLSLPFFRWWAEHQRTVAQAGEENARKDSGIERASKQASKQAGKQARNECSPTRSGEHSRRILLVAPKLNRSSQRLGGREGAQGETLVPKFTLL
jgi:hypothetical protein